jgi:hypothetical protein
LDKRCTSSPLFFYCFHLPPLRFYAHLTHRPLAILTGESLQLTHYPVPSCLLCHSQNLKYGQNLTRFVSAAISSCQSYLFAPLDCSSSNPAPENSAVLCFLFCFSSPYVLWIL